MKHLREVSAFTVAEQRTERAAQSRPRRSSSFETMFKTSCRPLQRLLFASKLLKY